MPSETILRQKHFRRGVLIAFCVALVALTVPEHPPRRASAQNLKQGRSEAGDLRCASYCSATRPGNALMEVRVRLAASPLKETALLEDVREQGLDVTVYSDGFTRGLYATVPVLREKALFLAPEAKEKSVRAARVKSKIPGLERLVVTDVITRLDKSADSLRLMQQMTLPSTQAEPEGEWVTVRLEGAESGVEYTFRVPGGESVVKCQATVCPADLLPAPARGAGSKSKSKRQRLTKNR